MWKNRLKPYDILSGEDVEAIHEQAMTILEEIGVDFLHDRPRELFAKAGMAVDGMRCGSTAASSWRWRLRRLRRSTSRRGIRCGR